MSHQMSRYRAATFLFFKEIHHIVNIKIGLQALTSVDVCYRFDLILHETFECPLVCSSLISVPFARIQFTVFTHVLVLGFLVFTRHNLSFVEYTVMRLSSLYSTMPGKRRNQSVFQVGPKPQKPGQVVKSFNTRFTPYNKGNSILGRKQTDPGAE